MDIHNNCKTNCFHMLFSSITWNNIKNFISGNDMLGFVALPGALVGGVCHFLDQTAFHRIFAGKIIVPVHLNSPSSYLNFLCFKTLKIRAWIGRNAFVFAAQTSARMQSAIWKEKILSGISFAKINKNCPSYPLNLISLAIRKQKNQSEIVLQSGIPMTYQ